MSDEHANAAERMNGFTRTAPGARSLAARLEDDPSMMAWVLARYRAAEDKDDRDMAQLLRIDENQLPHLALCRRPREDLFSDDVDAISAHIGVDPDLLTDVVRHVEVIDAFAQHRQRFGRANTGLVAAARDRAAEDPAPYDADAAGAADDAADDPAAFPPDRDDTPR